MKHKPGIRCVNHQTRLIQIPSIKVRRRLNDVLDSARVRAVGERNRIAHTSLRAIWIYNHVTIPEIAGLKVQRSGGI